VLAKAGGIGEMRGEGPSVVKGLVGWNHGWCLPVVAGKCAFPGWTWEGRCWMPEAPQWANRRIRLSKTVFLAEWSGYTF
jgi:hypothetical protein